MTPTDTPAAQAMREEGLRALLQNCPDDLADKALAATTSWLDIKGSALTVNREKMRLRLRAFLKAADDRLVQGTERRASNSEVEGSNPSAVATAPEPHSEQIAALAVARDAQQVVAALLAHTIAERDDYAAKAVLLLEQQDANAGLVRKLAERDEEIAALKAERDDYLGQIIAYRESATYFEAQAVMERENALCAERDALRGALEGAARACKSILHLIKPTAEDYPRKDMLEGLPDSHLFELTWAPENPTYPTVTAGQLRRLRAEIESIRKVLTP